MYELLSDMGHDPVVEGDGEKAVERFRKDPGGFDLVLTDLAMFGMTGDSVSEEITSMRPDVPVVVMTATPENLTREKAESAGVCRVLPKPLTKAELCQALTEVAQLKCMAY